MTARDLAADLAESDSAYFEWGARREPLEGAWLAWMPGFEDVAAGCVVHRLAESFEGGGAWLTEVEARLRELGCLRPRFYLHAGHVRLEAVLRADGYRPREELGLLLLDPRPCLTDAVLLRPVRTDADWATKVALHTASDVGPDGHETRPERWVEMERRKSREGPLEPFLIEAAGDVCGAVGVAECGGILRMKNLVVHPAARRRGIALDVVGLVATIAAIRGKAAIGCFAFADGPAEAVYRRCGLEVVTRQTEWIRRQPPLESRAHLVEEGEAR